MFPSYQANKLKPVKTGCKYAVILAAMACLFNTGNALAASAIGSRNTSITLDLGNNKSAYIVGLTSSEASSITAFNYLQSIHPYDAEKTGLDDINSCWAATASNVLAYTGWGNVNGFKTEDNIFSYYKANFDDEAGRADYAIDWFLTGNYPAANLADWAHPEEGAGGFWKDTVDINEVGVLEFGAGSLLDRLQNDYAAALSIGWYNASGDRYGGHAVTVWGATYDNLSGDLLSLLISDSDNNILKNGEAPDTLDELVLAYNSDGKYYGFTNGIFSDGRIEDFYFLKVLTAVPEPETWAMLLAGLGLVGAAARRRHNQSLR
jgi:hypothetical protein